MKKRDLGALLPNQIRIGKVLEILKISMSKFYWRFYKQHLFPVRKIGRSEYFDIKEVYDLKRRLIIRPPFRRINPVATQHKGKAA